jgi:hypothetical protein
MYVRAGITQFYELVAAVKNNYIYLIQKRPHNNGIIDSVVIGHYNSNGEIIQRRRDAILHAGTFRYPTAAHMNFSNDSEYVLPSLPVEFKDIIYPIIVGVNRSPISEPYSIRLYQRRRPNQGDIIQRDNTIILSVGVNTSTILFNAFSRIFRRREERQGERREERRYRRLSDAIEQWYVEHPQEAESLEEEDEVVSEYNAYDTTSDNIRRY